MDSNKEVPYIVHEGDMARLERANRRLWILCVIMFLALCVTNAGWIYYESQWEEVVTTEEVAQDVDTGEGDAVVNGIGNIYGESKAINQKDYQNP